MGQGIAPVPRSPSRAPPPHLPLSACPVNPMQVPTFAGPPPPGGEGGYVHAAQPRVPHPHPSPSTSPLFVPLSTLCRYLHLLDRHPLAVKAGTSMLLNLLGDLFCQLVVEGGHGVDARRAATISLLGLLLVGPTLHVW
ncbi:unnamed protein product [Closterium sp. NIES-54]